MIMEDVLSAMCLDDLDEGPGDVGDQTDKISRQLRKIAKKKNKKIRKDKKKKWKNKNKLTEQSTEMIKQITKRVNHFVAIQVTSSNIHEQVKVIQKKILSSPYTPPNRGDAIITSETELDKKPEIGTGAIFADAMERIPSLHVSLNVIGLYNEDDKNKAKEAFETCWERHKSTIIENPLNLDVVGLSHFGKKVLYANVKGEENVKRLQSLSDDLRMEFKKANIFQCSTPFKPHMTIAKLSKSRTLFKQKIRSFPPEIWTDYESHDFGQQPVESLQLLAMTRDPSTNYYQILSELQVAPSLSLPKDDDSMVIS